MTWQKKYKSFCIDNPDDARLYRIWNDMKRRCNDPRRRDYVRYGGRGISVCDEWMDFQKFLDWSRDNGYCSTLSLDRIDNEGNYCPENCRWASPMVQSNNRRNNRRLTLNGKTQSMAAWSRELGISYFAIRQRKNRGWSDEDTLTIPTKVVAT